MHGSYSTSSPSKDTAERSWNPAVDEEACYEAPVIGDRLAVKRGTMGWQEVVVIAEKKKGKEIMSLVRFCEAPGKTKTLLGSKIAALAGRPNYKCSICSFIYPAGTAFADESDAYRCPTCNSPKSMFRRVGDKKKKKKKKKTMEEKGSPDDATTPNKKARELFMNLEARRWKMVCSKATLVAREERDARIATIRPCVGDAIIVHGRFGTVLEVDTSAQDEGFWRHKLDTGPATSYHASEEQARETMWVCLQSSGKGASRWRKATETEIAAASQHDALSSLVATSSSSSSTTLSSSSSGGAGAGSAAAAAQDDSPYDEAEQERRLDVSSGQAFTRQEFVDFYGDTSQWDTSFPVNRCPSSPQRRCTTDELYKLTSARKVGLLWRKKARSKRKQRMRDNDNAGRPAVAAGGQAEAASAGDEDVTAVDEVTEAAVFAKRWTIINTELPKPAHRNRTHMDDMYKLP